MAYSYHDPSSPGRKKGFPWIYYENDGNKVITGTDINLEVTFNEKSTSQTNKFEYYLAKYDIYGNYLGISPVTNELFVCPTFFTDSDIYRTFGSPITIT